MLSQGDLPAVRRWNNGPEEIGEGVGLKRRRRVDHLTARRIDCALLSAHATPF